jgi:hypothetical protein
MRILLFILFLPIYSITAWAQSAPKFPVNIRTDRQVGASGEDAEEQSPREERFKEMELKREEGDYKEHVARTKENAQLALEIWEAFAQYKTLRAAELKKLGLIEKLSRKIRNKAGGEENKEELQTPPQQVEEALKRLAELTAELQKKVENTPRQVVSTAVIKCANEVVELVRYIRSLYR